MTIDIDIKFTGTALVTTDGEVLARISARGELEPTDLLGDVLRAYADNQARAQLAAMDMNEIVERAKRVPEFIEAQVRYEAAMGVCRAIEDGLTEALANRPAGTKISIDTGGVLVTAGKARATWKLAHPASWYAGVGVRDQLARFITPYIKAGSAIETIAQAVVDWLDPQETVGDIPPVKLTVRPPER